MAEKLNIKIDQGCNFDMSLVWKTKDRQIIDLTNYTITMQIKQNSSSGLVLVDLSSVGNGILINNNVINISIVGADTVSIPFGRHYYEILATHTDGTVSPLMSGLVDIKRETTRTAVVPRLLHIFMLVETQLTRYLNIHQLILKR